MTKKSIIAVVIIGFITVTLFLGIISQVSAHSENEDSDGTNKGWGCMNMSREDFTKFHEGMWDFMNESGVEESMMQT